MGSSPIQVAIYASVAQSVEQGTENPRVIGSIPIGGTIYADLAHLVERHLAKVEVASSSLVIRSKRTLKHPLSVLYLTENQIRHHSQVVRQRSAKPLRPGSNPGGASKNPVQRKLGGILLFTSYLFTLTSTKIPYGIFGK